MDELLKNELLGDLYAYYGPLLTAGQQDYFEDYYYNDLSLGEIAANHQVSRQAVYDNLRRSGKSLASYEEKLHLKRDYQEFAQQLALAQQALEQQNLPQLKEIIRTLQAKVKGE